MRPPFLVLTLVAPALVAVATPALAQDGQPIPSDAGAMATQAEGASGGDSITVGVGAAYLPDYEGSNDYQFTPAPGAIGSYKGFNFTLAGNRLSVDLIPDGQGPTVDIQAGPIGVVNFNRSSTDSIDDVRVRRLGELDTSIELGGYVGIGKTGVITSDYDRLSISVSYRHDVSGVHKSGIVQPTINYLTPLSRKAAVGLFASAERAEAGYARTYYSVTPGGAAASGLPVFNARGGWKNWTLGALGTYSLTGDLLHGVKLVAGGTYRRMLNDFADSPLVSIAGSRDQWLGAVGLAYTF
jgi:outer membrane protein